MQAACIVGGADARIQAALKAGCDMGLVCNDRSAACTALEGISDLPLPNQERLERMRGKIPEISVSETLNLGTEWEKVRDTVENFKNSFN